MTQAAPWSPETSPAVAADVQALMFEALRICGILLRPIMPSKADFLLDSLDVPSAERTLADADFGKCSVGSVRSGVRLFDVERKL